MLQVQSGDPTVKRHHAFADLKRSPCHRRRMRSSHLDSKSSRSTQHWPPRRAQGRPNTRHRLGHPAGQKQLKPAGLVDDYVPASAVSQIPGSDCTILDKNRGVIDSCVFQPFAALPAWSGLAHLSTVATFQNCASLRYQRLSQDRVRI